MESDGADTGKAGYSPALLTPMGKDGHQLPLQLGTSQSSAGLWSGFWLSPAMLMYFMD